MPGGFVETLRSEWGVISDAPWSVAAIVALTAGLSITGARTWFKQEMANLRSTVARLEGEAKSRPPAPSEDRRSSPRKLTTHQKVIFERAIRPAKAIATIRANTSAPDGLDYADGLADAFAGAGWTVRRSTTTGVSNSPPTGVGLCHLPAGNRTQEEAVAYALSEAGIEFDWRPEADLDPDDGVLVLISHRL